NRSQPQPTSPSPSASLPPIETTLNPALLALIRQQDKQDENLFAPITLPPSSLEAKTSETKPERLGPLPKQTTAVEQSSAPLPKQSETSSDDQLFNLLQKDLDRVFEQQTERRRLEFSKAVTEHPKVRYYINYFSNSAKSHFQNALTRSGKYMPMITKILGE